MNKKNEHGLGELLRHLVELCDESNQTFYQKLDFSFRPRFTPVMRALSNGSLTISELTTRLSVSQGAISQTITLMLKAGLVLRKRGADGRQSVVQLSSKGKSAIGILKPHWSAVFDAIKELEREIDSPLCFTLQQAVEALEKKSFIDRIKGTKRHRPSNKKGYFQSDGKNYAKFRPKYPKSLVEELLKHCPENRIAVDVGCGTGQLTCLLAQRFKKVIGVDNSNSQISNTKNHSRIDYRVGSAEKIDCESSTADLIVAAQAAHWFDLPKFYTEAIRIAKPGAVIGLISYGVPWINDSVNTVFQKGYWRDLFPFWPSERRHVENGYSQFDFPFQRISMPSFQSIFKLSCNEFCGYIKTWSAAKRAVESGQQDVVDRFLDQIKTGWASNGKKEVTWPIVAIVGHVKVD